MASTSSLLNFLTPLFPSSNNPKFPNSNPIFPISSTSQSNPSSNSLSISSKNHENAAAIAITKKEEYPEDIMALVCPSLAFSNTLYFRSAYNVQVLVDDNEPEERLLNRFRREVMRAGVIQECKRRRYFENKQDKEKRKHREAAKRNSRRRRGPFRPFPGKEEETKVEKKEDDGDNWDMPEGDAPF